MAACSSLQGAAQSACNQATFVDHVIVDLPVEQGSVLMPGMQFTKTWRVINSGDCTWTEDYALALSGGESFSDTSTYYLQTSLAPGESLDISIPIEAPDIPGLHFGEWEFQSPDDEIFGVGKEGTNPLRVEFNVPLLSAGIIYEFDQLHCMAIWNSGAATFLPCQGLADEVDLRQGYVRLNEDAAIEGSSANNPPVIEMKPNNQQEGWIAGYFPGIEIQEGDTFSAQIGCLDLLEECALLFSFHIEMQDGEIEQVASWVETYDDNSIKVEASLNAYAGQRVNFILRLEEEGSGRSLEAIGYWLNARIGRK